MTNEQAKSELMQIYMSLSEEKKKALDVAFKAMEQAIPEMYYPQVDGITPTVVAQADGEYIGDRLISEKAVLEAFREYQGSISDFYKAVKAMPSAEPKTGHWIYDDIANNWRCDKCGETPKTMGYVGSDKFMAEHFKFCNHCGARMVEPQEGSKE